MNQLINILVAAIFICCALTSAEFFDDKYSDAGKLTGLVCKITDFLGVTNNHKGYSGLFWNTVDSLDLAKQDKFFKCINATGNTLLDMQMEHAEPSVADHHYEQDESLYSKTHFPVLRPNEMGNYPHGTHLIDLSELYVAVGAIQHHLSEMKDFKKTQEASEQNPEAPIFQKVDLGLETNLFRAFLELIGKI